MSRIPSVTPSSAVSGEIEEMEDVCALPLVQRVAALLDTDPSRLRIGEPMPRGWHAALFTVATRQSELRPDGVAGLGVKLPDLGLPRIMMGGKRARFDGDIIIGATARRMSQTTSVMPKSGRTGRFVIVTMQHKIFSGTSTSPVLVEEQDYVMREGGEVENASGGSAVAPTSPRLASDIERTIVPDEPMLFRYSAITFNTHRIHYDLPYATAKEHYPALVVNGSIAALFLVEMFKAWTGRQPNEIVSRNLAPLYCGRPVKLRAASDGAVWRSWAEDDTGRTAVEVVVQ